VSQAFRTRGCSLKSRTFLRTRTEFKSPYTIPELPPRYTYLLTYYLIRDLGHAEILATMNYPRIDYASQIINNIKLNTECIAIIQPIAKPVYIIADDFPQQELDKYSTVLNSGTEDRWISNSDVPGSRFRVVVAATAIDIPKLCISPGLIRSKPDLQPPGSPALTYLFLVQGKNASERTKAVARSTRDGAAAAMLHEVALFLGSLHTMQPNLSQETCFVGRELPSARRQVSWLRCEEC
jgi:hypothetical protein